MLFERPIAPETYAVIRFGLGFPARSSPLDAEGILARLAGPDQVIQAYPLQPFERAVALTEGIKKARKDSRMLGNKDALNAARAEMKEAFAETLKADFIRAVETEDPFRERLHNFWLNHFAARSKSYHLRSGHAGYAAEAIRPHLNGRFADMLKAVVTHPFMLAYLDQRASVGPNSEIGLKSGRGLNENLARELMELHTLGVDADYTQRDVRQLAELLTGLFADNKRGFAFRANRAEPGTETILGVTYGDGSAALDHIFAALEDLAIHPSTGRHLARKLAAHFIADDPDPDLVTHMAQGYAATHGRLDGLYAAMLEHPAAWRDFGRKVKWPIDMMATAMRALGARAPDIEQFSAGGIRKLAGRPLRRMGQPYAEPPGPDGWADYANAWVNPHGLAGRIGWSMAVAQKLGKRAPDPRDFVVDALADVAGRNLVQAAHGAETKAEGVALILASAEFNRR